ncbi:MAG: hypothetical protein C4347_01910 [Patescibacteria group bacterium]
MINYFIKGSQFDIYFLFSLLFSTISLSLFFIIKEDKREKIFKLILFFLLIFYFLYSSFLLIIQYYVWKNSPFSKYLLPPYLPITYFLSYSLFMFFRDFFFRIIGLFLIILIANLIIFILKRDPFYEDEKPIIYLCSMLLSFPYNFFFIFLSFFILLLMGILSWKVKEYISFRNFWLILINLLLILEPFIFSNFTFLIQIKP